MKKSLLFSTLLSFMSIATYSQVQIDRPIDLNSSTPANARIMGIKQVNDPQDAVSAEVLQSGSLVYATSAGTSSAYTLALAPVAIGSYTTGMEIRFKAHTANAAGAVTMDVNGLGTKPIKKDVSSNLALGDIQNGQLVTLVYDGTNFQLLSRITDANSGGTVTSISTTAPITGGTISTTGTIGITQSGTSSNGYLSSTDWNTFNGKQPAGNYITALTGDVTASGPGSATATIANNAVTSAKILNGEIVDADINASAGIVDTKLATISTGGKVSNSATTATAASSLNTIVLRDGSGNFSATTINAALNGNATTATTATNFSGSLAGEVTGTQGATVVGNAAVLGKVLTGYVSGAGTITASDNILQAIQKLNGNNATNANLTGMVTSVGNATTVVTNANLTGDVTSVGNATTVGKINGTSLAGLATGILKNTNTTGVPSIATAGTDYVIPSGSISGSAGSFTGSLAGDVTGTQSATTVGKINGTSLAGLATGILKNTTTTGVPVIATAGTDYVTPSGSISGSAGSFTGSLAGDVTGTQGATTVGKINGTSLAGLATGLLKNTTTTGVPVIATAGTDYVAPNAAITGATNTKITYDAKGLVTSGTTLAAADIPNLDVAKITTGVLPIARGGTNTGTIGGAGTVAFSNGTVYSFTANSGATNQVLHGSASGTPSFSQVNLAADVTGVLPAANGGTSFSSYTTGDLLYASGAGTLAKLADVATGNALISGGAGVAPSWNKIGLTTHVTGILPVANGGTGSSSQNWVDLTTAQTAAGAKTWSNNAVFNGGTTTLSNGTNNFLVFTTGTGTPAFTTRSNGTKIVLNSSISASAVDYAMGVCTGCTYPQTWTSIPSADATKIFAWYAGTTTMAAMGYTAPFFNAQADMSSYDYYASATGWVYSDIYADLDQIDAIRPMRVKNPKTGVYEVANDPSTVPQHLLKKGAEENIYGVSMSRATAFSIGAIRMLRRETETRDKGLEAKIEQLQTIIEQLTGKKIEDATFIEETTAFKGMDKLVVSDGRLKADSKVTATPVNSSVGFHIEKVEKGSFTLVFDAPLGSDIKFNYSSTYGKQ